MPDYYRLLGLVPDATDGQVRRAVRRYWQHVARFRPAREQGPFLTAATVLGNPQLRAVYDPAYRPGPEPAHLQAAHLRQLSARLRTELHQAQARCYRLEGEVRGLRASLSHALHYPEEMTARRQERRRQWGRLLLLLLLPLAYGLLRHLSGSSAAELAGPPYQPVAAGAPWLLAHSDSAQVYEQAELMPQFAGGVGGVRDFLRQRVYQQASSAVAKRLCANGQVQFVVDSAGRVEAARGLGVADSAGVGLLRRAGQRLPRFVPGYQRGRPVVVRFTVPLAD